MAGSKVLDVIECSKMLMDARVAGVSSSRAAGRKRGDGAAIRLGANRGTKISFIK